MNKISFNFKYVAREYHTNMSILKGMEIDLYFYIKILDCIANGKPITDHDLNKIEEDYKKFNIELMEIPEEYRMEENFPNLEEESLNMFKM